MTARIWVGFKPEVGQTYELIEQACNHLQVLRKKHGDKIILFDGTNGEYGAQVQSVTKKSVAVLVVSYHDDKISEGLKQTLFIADCTAQKMTWIIQKATELAVHTIQPISSMYTKSKAGKNQVTQEKLERLDRIAISAAEQCRLNRLPKIHASQSLDTALTTATTVNCFIGAVDGKHPLAIKPPKNNISWIIGPEGGWHPEELAYFEKLQLTKIKFSPTILRMETAVCAALTIGNMYSTII